MKLFHLLGLTILLTAPATATTIVAVKTPTEIVIGADSKVTDTFGNAVAGEACKIIQAGTLYFAYEGLVKDRRTGFDVAAIARRALMFKPNASVAERVDILTGFVTAQLFRELPDLKQQDPDTYREKVEGGQTFLKILIAGFEGTHPLLFVRQFRAVPVTRQTIGVSIVPDDCLKDCAGAAVVRALGETAAIDGLPEETSGFWEQGLAAGVRRLIETEIAARGEYVGPPVDILRIDRRGAQWIQRKALCNETLKRPAAPARTAPRTRRKPMAPPSQ